MGWQNRVNRMKCSRSALVGRVWRTCEEIFCQWRTNVGRTNSPTYDTTDRRANSPTYEGYLPM